MFRKVLVFATASILAGHCLAQENRDEAILESLRSEIRENPQSPDPGKRETIKGTLGESLAAPPRIVVDDRVYPLSETVKLNGVNLPASTVVQQVGAPGASARVKLGTKRNGGDVSITEIETGK